MKDADALLEVSPQRVTLIYGEVLATSSSYVGQAVYSCLY